MGAWTICIREPVWVTASTMPILSVDGDLRRSSTSAPANRDRQLEGDLRRSATVAWMVAATSRFMANRDLPPAGIRMTIRPRGGCRIRQWACSAIVPV